MTEDKWARRIAALLAKAESTNHEKERETYLAKAQELQLQYVIEDDAIRKAKGQKRENIVHVRFCEERHGSLIKAKRELVSALAKLNRSQAILGHRRAYIEVTGFESDVQFISIIYTSLLLQMQTAMARAEVFRYEDGTSIKTWRTSYAHAWVRRVASRLKEEMQASEASAEASTPGSALVLRDRKLEVTQSVSERYGRLRSGYKNTATGSAAGYTQGDLDGRRANIHHREGVGQSRSKLL